MNNKEKLNENIEIEYIDVEFFNMNIDEQINYLMLNPDKKIHPEDVESSFFYELSQEILEKGEKELYITILKKYFEAAVELQHASYRRVKPDIDAIYQYGMHLLNNKITPFEEIDINVKKMFVSFIILNEYVDVYDDECFDRYPQLITFYQNLDKFAYADDDAVCAIMLRNVGSAYQKGTKYFEKDLEKAFEFFEIGAGFDYEGRQVAWPFQRVADCLFELAACYMKGLGVERNLDAALECFENAAKEYGLDSVPAMAEIYLDDDFDWKEYFNERADLIFAAYDAYENSREDVTYLHYDWDCGFDDFDENKANFMRKCIIDEIKKLANEGNIEAKYRLANVYEKGIFLEQNLELAFKYHTELMNEGGYPHSAMFYYENHVPRDRESYQIPAELKIGDEFYLGELIDEPLKWKVVELQEDGPVVISEKILAVLPYGNNGADYEHSYVRKWLNDQFFEKAFTIEEKKNILEEEYYAMSFSNDTYGQKILLKDYLFLPYSANIDSWYGEGKDEWKVEHTQFSLKTERSDDCWLLDVYNSSCPKHVNANNKSTRLRFNAGCKLGVRPIMILKK